MVKQKHLSFVQVEDTEQKDFPYHMVSIDDPESKHKAAVKSRIAKERQLIDSLKTSVSQGYYSVV